jgi:hypothetical protein
MKQAALQALQHVRTTLAYQLTPEAVSELLEPIQRVLDGRGSILEHVELTVPYIAAHNDKADEAHRLVTSACCAFAHVDPRFGSYEEAEEIATQLKSAIRSLRL